MQQRIDALPTDLAHRRIFAEHLPADHAGGRRGDRRRPLRGPGVGRELGRRLRRPVPGRARRRPRRPDRATSRGPGGWPSTRPADLPPLRHVLLGINAHVNYDLPQALLAVISDDDFTDPVLIGRRQRDHERIDAVLASRVADEDGMLGPLSVLDRLLATAEPGQLEALPARGPGEGLAQRRATAARPAGRSRRLPAAGWPSWRCSARPRSPICSRPGRCCCGWRSPGSAWCCRRRKCRRRRGVGARPTGEAAARRCAVTARRRLAAFAPRATSATSVTGRIVTGRRSRQCPSRPINLWTMCGIVGYTGPHQALPFVLAGLRPARVPRLRLGRRRRPGRRRATCTPPRRPARWSTSSGYIDAGEVALGGTDRHGAHPLGHPRRPDRPQRAPAHRRQRPGRRHPQRHHRELRPAAGRLEAQGIEMRSDTDTEVVAHLLGQAFADGPTAGDLPASMARRLPHAWTARSPWSRCTPTSRRCWSRPAATRRW